MPIRLDYSKAESGFKTLDAGFYRAKVFDVQTKTAGPTAKNAGAMLIEFTYKLTHVGEGESRGTRQVWNNFTIVPNQMWRFQEYLVKCHGYDPESFDEDFEFDESDVKGQEVILKLDVHTYQGKQQNGVVDALHIDSDVELADETD